MGNDDSGHQTPDQAARGGSARYGKAEGAEGSGHQESRKTEEKEEAGRFKSRQGGSQPTSDPRAGPGSSQDGPAERPDDSRS